MGGKTKQSQRTKNNVRPSSSGRSAELLSGSNWSMGTDSMVAAQVLPLFPTLADTITTDQCLNANFLLCIKKLSKKDPVTKIKALQELTNLVINGSEDDIKSILPYWTRSYQTLSTDVDHKVREATQTTHARLCTRAGRAIAPQLRRLIPTWLAAQFDPYAPAAAAARDSLANTFPENKLPEVLSFCKTELMTTIWDNLFANTEVSMTKKSEEVGSGGVDAEAERGRRERMLCGALRSLCCVCAFWDAGAAGDWLTTQLAALFDAPAFWKLTTNPALSVKAAWVCTLGQMWMRCGPELRTQHAARAERALLAAAGAAQGQRSSLLVRSLADCFATFTSSTNDDQQDWAEWIQNKDDLCKKILIMIENGGWGDTRAALALARTLPPCLLTTRYNDLFRALLAGLENKSVLNSKGERQVWVSGIEECVRRVSARAPDAALSAHRAWLELVLGPKLDNRVRTHIIEISATAMVSLLVYWMRQSVEHQGEEFDRLVRNFWHNLGSTLLGSIDELTTNHTEIENCVDAHVAFLRSLKTSFSNKSKKRSKVRFENDHDDYQPEEDELKTPPPLEDSFRERYDRDLRVLIDTVCSQYFKFSEAKEVSTSIFTRLVPLLKEFDSTELFVAIARCCGEDESEHWTPYRWYEKKLIRWLAGDTMRCQPLAELVIMLVPHLTATERVYALSTLETLPPAVVEWCVRFAACHPHCERPPIRDWLRGATPARTLAAACRRFILHGDEAARDLLLLCLAQHHDEALVNEDAISGVLKELTHTLENAEADAPQLGRVAALAARLAPVQAAGPTPSASLDVLLCAMFEVNMRFAPNDDGVTSDIWEAVRSAWRAALGTAPPHQRQITLDGILRNVRKFTLFDECQPDIGCMKRVAELCHHLIESDAAVRAQVSAVLMQPAQDHLVVSLETFALRLDTLTGRLSCPLSDCEPAHRLALAAADARPGELDRHAVLLFTRHLLFRALFLRAFAVDTDPDVNATCGDVLMADDAMRTHFLQLLKDFAILDTLHRGYGFWPHYEFIEECHDTVTEALDHIIKEGHVEVQDKVYSELTKEAIGQGYYWTLARKYFGIRYRAMGPADWLRVCDTNAPLDTPPSGFFHNLQVCCEESEEPWEQYRARWACAVRAWSAAHGARPALQPRLACVMPDLCAASLDLFVDCYYADNDTMLYDRELGSATWTEAAGVSGVVSAMSALVKARGADLPAHHWDFINISLCSLVNSVRLSAEANQWPTTIVTMIARSVLELADQVAAFVDEVPTLGTRRQLSDHVAALPTEWRDVFAPELFANLLLFALIVLENGAKYGEEMVTTTHVVTVCALVRSMRRLRWTLVGAARRAQDLSAERLAAVCGAAFTAPAHPLYLRLAYYLLHCIMEPLFNDDVEKLKVWTDNENADDIERPRFSLHYFEDSLRRVLELANAALDAVTTGEETCEPAPASAAHRALLAQLLLCERLLSIARRAHDFPDLMEHYIAFFRGNDYIETLLCVCLRLMPARLLGPGAPPPEYAPLFTTDPDFCSENSLRPNSARAALTALACRCLYLGVGGCGAAAAAARGWWGAAPARLHRLLQRLVSAYVTPALVRAQLGEVATRGGRLADTELVVHLSTRELECSCSVDERPVRLRLQLSDHHPLGAPRVDAEGAPDPNLLSLAVPLAAQNGSVWRALRLWRARLVRHVENAPVCYVCYMRLHPDSGRLPRQRCSQCRNKFHHECLQKWFTTSKKMECPLCRAVYKS